MPSPTSKVQSKSCPKKNLKEAKILRSDLEELSRVREAIKQPLETGKKVNLNKFQGALDFMSDLNQLTDKMDLSKYGIKK